MSLLISICTSRWMKIFDTSPMQSPNSLGIFNQINGTSTVVRWHYFTVPKCKALEAISVPFARFVYL